MNKKEKIKSKIEYYLNRKNNKLLGAFNLWKTFDLPKEEKEELKFIKSFYSDTKIKVTQDSKSIKDDEFYKFLSRKLDVKDLTIIEDHVNDQVIFLSES